MHVSFPQVFGSKSTLVVLNIGADHDLVSGGTLYRYYCTAEYTLDLFGD